MAKNSSPEENNSDGYKLDNLLRRMLSTPPQPKVSQPTQKQVKPKVKKANK